jgi:hypothetical protein
MMESIECDSMNMPSSIQYVKLDEKSAEIRLITLSPGTFSDIIRCTIWHTSLKKPPSSQRQRLSLDQLRKTLPPGRDADETEQDQYRFLFTEDQTQNTSWTHPDPNCDPALWQPLPELPPADFQPTFEALSYTWGPGENPEMALMEYICPDSQFCPNHGKPMTLPIRQNLAAALRHLRYPDKPRTMWVDAICINHMDKVEEGHQIKHMWLIYRLAQRVVVWLGPDSHNSALAISTLRYLGSQLELGRNNTRYRSPQATEPNWFRTICPLPYDEETWQAVGDLFRRSWFERLWVWQEIQLANSRAMIVCGEQEIPWQCLRRSITCLMTKQELPSRDLRRRLEIVEPLTNERGGSSMSHLLDISRRRKCLDPKDKIYGMLSICSPKLASTIEPRYESSWSVADVYRDVFLRYLDQAQRLDLLSGCDSSLQQIPGPSWVPDWSVPRKTSSLYPFTFASGVSRSQTRYIEPGVLQVTGCRAAVLQKVSEQAAPVDPLGIIDAIKKWAPKDLCEGTYITGQSLLDAYCTTLMAGYLTERIPVSSDLTLQEWKEQLLRMLSSSSSEILSRMDVENDAYIFWLLKLVQGRKFVETEEGYMALGPSGALPGK